MLKATVAENTYYGTFSPDGRHIAYVQGRKGIWVCDAVEGSKKRLAETTDDWYPICYPDSLHLFYFSASYIPNGQNASRYVLLLGGERPGSEETKQRKIIIFDTETGGYDTPAGSGGICEECF